MFMSVETRVDENQLVRVEINNFMLVVRPYPYNEILRQSGLTNYNNCVTIKILLSISHLLETPEH